MNLLKSITIKLQLQFNLRIRVVSQLIGHKYATCIEILLYVLLALNTFLNGESFKKPTPYCYWSISLSHLIHKETFLLTVLNENSKCM